MSKKLIFIPLLLSITACSAKNIEEQCPPEQNYMISNPAAMEEYNQLKKEGKIKSYFSDHNRKDICRVIYCVRFDPKQYDFIEKRFDDDYRKGIYTIYASTDLSRNDCFDDPTYKSPYCFYAVKNENDVVKSRYRKYSRVSRKPRTPIVTGFDDLKNNISLFKYSYTTYSTGALGGPGFGMCGSKNNNNPDYDFNITSYP